MHYVPASEPDLSRARDVGSILGGAFELYRRRFGLFATIAFAVVVPIDLLIYGVWGELLWSSKDFGDSLPNGAAVGSTLAPFVLITPLVTAGHVRAVMDLAERREASASAALGAAASRLTPVVLAVLLSQVASTLALLLLIVPGVYLWVGWWVSAQAVVAEERGALEGMRRSRELVKGGWWRVFGIALLISLIGGVIGAVLGIPLFAIGALADTGLPTLLGQILLDAVVYSFTALAGTLLFFDLKARAAGMPPPGAYYQYPPGAYPPGSWDAPERPY